MQPGGVGLHPGHGPDGGLTTLLAGLWWWGVAWGVVHVGSVGGAKGWGGGGGGGDGGRGGGGGGLGGGVG